MPVPVAPRDVEIESTANPQPGRPDHGCGTGNADSSSIPIMTCNTSDQVGAVGGQLGQVFEMILSGLERLPARGTAVGVDGTVLAHRSCTTDALATPSPMRARSGIPDRSR